MSRIPARWFVPPSGELQRGIPHVDDRKSLPGITCQGHRESILVWVERTLGEWLCLQSSQGKKIPLISFFIICRLFMQRFERLAGDYSIFSSTRLKFSCEAISGGEREKHPHFLGEGIPKTGVDWNFTEIFFLKSHCKGGCPNILCYLLVLQHGHACIALQRSEEREFTSPS